MQPAQSSSSSPPASPASPPLPASCACVVCGKPPKKRIHNIELHSSDSDHELAGSGTAASSSSMPSPASSFPSAGGSPKKIRRIVYRGIVCASGEHFTCSRCITQTIKRQWPESLPEEAAAPVVVPATTAAAAAAAAPAAAAPAAAAGTAAAAASGAAEAAAVVSTEVPELRCTGGGGADGKTCASPPFTDTQVAHNAKSGALALYLRARQRARDAITAREAQEQVRRAVEEAKAKHAAESKATTTTTAKPAAKAEPKTKTADAARRAHENYRNIFGYDHDGEGCICEYCDEFFDFEDELWDHLDEDHGVVCQDCGEMFYDDEELQEHRFDEHDAYCEYCDEMFDSEDELAEHVAEEHTHVCADCGSTFEFEDDLHEHRYEQHMFVCSGCGAEFETQRELDRHHGDDWEDDFSDDDDDEDDVDDDEGDEGDDGDDDEIPFVVNDSGRREYFCHCGRSFGTRRAAREHRDQSHAAERQEAQRTAAAASATLASTSASAPSTSASASAAPESQVTAPTATAAQDKKVDPAKPATPSAGAAETPSATAAPAPAAAAASSATTPAETAPAPASSTSTTTPASSFSSVAALLAAEGEVLNHALRPFVDDPSELAASMTRALPHSPSRVSADDLFRNVTRLETLPCFGDFTELDGGGGFRCACGNAFPTADDLNTHRHAKNIERAADGSVPDAVRRREVWTTDHATEEPAFTPGFQRFLFEMRNTRFFHRYGLFGAQSCWNGLDERVRHAIAQLPPPQPVPAPVAWPTPPPATASVFGSASAPAFSFAPRADTASAAVPADAGFAALRHARLPGIKKTRRR